MAYNLGNGDGYSVKQVISTAREITGRNITIVEGERRSGDPARLVADSRRAITVLGWKPKYADLETIVKHAWGWESKQVSR